MEFRVLAGQGESASYSSSQAKVRLAILWEQGAHTHHKELARWHNQEWKRRERKEKEIKVKEGRRKGKEGRKEIFLNHLLCARYFHMFSHLAASAQHYL